MFSVIVLAKTFGMIVAAILVVRQEDEGQQEAARVLARLGAEARNVPEAETVA